MSSCTVFAYPGFSVLEINNFMVQGVYGVAQFYQLLLLLCKHVSQIPLASPVGP